MARRPLTASARRRRLAPRRLLTYEPSRMPARTRATPCHASSSSRSSGVSARSGARTSAFTGTPCSASSRLSAACRGKRSTNARSSPRRAAPSGVGLAHHGGDLARERRRERRDRAARAARHPVGDERLRPDEDVEAREEVLLEGGEGRVGDLEADDVRRLVAKPLEHRRRNRVPGRRRELVDVERHGRARGRRREEVAVLRLLVELRSTAGR